MNSALSLSYILCLMFFWMISWLFDPVFGFFFFLNIINMMKHWHWPTRCIIFISVPMWKYIFKYFEWIKNAGKEIAAQSLVLDFNYSPYRDVHIIEQQRAALTQKLPIYIKEFRENVCGHFRFLSHHCLSFSAWESCFSLASFDLLVHPLSSNGGGSCWVESFLFTQSRVIHFT